MKMSVTFLVYILVENGSLKAADLLLAIRVNPGMFISVQFAVMSFSLVHQTRISTFSTQSIAYTFCVSTGRYTSFC